VGQERDPNPAKTFFFILENAYFRNKNAVLIRRRPFF